MCLAGACELLSVFVPLLATCSLRPVWQILLQRTFLSTVPDLEHDCLVTCVAVCVWCSGCRLSGSISREVALLTYLTQLQLQHNSLSGSIEDGLWTLPQLQYADLSSNRFYGTLSRMTG